MPCLGYTTPTGVNLTHEEITKLSNADLETAFQLPWPVVRLLAGGPRDEDPKVVHVTRLTGDTRKAVLEERVEGYAELASQFWSVFGTAVHASLAIGNKQAEQTYIVDVGDGYCITGTLDWDEPKRISDYKYTSAWTGKYLNAAVKQGNHHNERRDWWDQLDFYAALKAAAGRPAPESTRIVCIFRDWQPAQAAQYKDYPKIPIAMYPGREVNTGEALKTMLGKLSALIEGRTLDESNLPLCEDLWGIDRKTGAPRHCSYCSARSLCGQYRSYTRK